MSSSETAAPTLASLVGSQDVARIVRLVRALGTTLAAQISDGKARLVHPTQVLLKTAPSGEETIDLRESVALSGPESQKDPAIDLLVAYVAPEVLSGKPDAVASTIYHLAGVAYHLLSGEPPFSGSSAAAVRIKVLLEKPVSPRSLRPELSPALDELLLSALDKKPDARPPSIDDFLNRLAVAATLSVAPEAAQSVQLRAASSPPVIAAGAAVLPVGARRGRSLALWGLLSLVVVLGFGSLLLLSKSEEQAPAPSAMAPVSSEERRVSERIGGAARVAPAPPGGGSASAPGSAMPPPPPPAPAPAQGSAPPGAPSAAAPMAERAHVRHDSKGKSSRASAPSDSARGAASLDSGAIGHGTSAPAMSKPMSRAAQSAEGEGGDGMQPVEEEAKTAKSAKTASAKKKSPTKDWTKSKVETVSKMGSKSKPKEHKSDAPADGVGAIPRESTPSKLDAPETVPSPEPVATNARSGAPSEEPGGAERGLAEPPQPSSIPAPARPKKTLIAALLIGLALFAGLAAIGLLWVIRRDQRLALQSAKTQTKPSEADTLPSQKQEDTKSKKGEIDPFTVGQYTCFARLGEGGMGMVYKARHTNLDREAAVKVLSPSAMIAPDAIELFQREAKLASQINHPNSVFIYDYGNVSGALFYLVMEFIDGQSLDEIISPKGKSPRPLPLPRVLTITKQICSVLDTAHGQGIVHRDLKPHKITPVEKWLSDFLIPSEKCGEVSTLHTCCFKSSERISKQAHSART